MVNKNVKKMIYPRVQDVPEVTVEAEDGSVEIGVEVSLLVAKGSSGLLRNCMHTP